MHHRNGARGARAVLYGLVVGAFSTIAAQAQTPIPGNYAPNAVNGMRAAVMPPPGTRIIENGSLFYFTDEFVDSSGNRIPTATTNGFANRTIIGYVIPDFKIFGADVNPAVIPVFANQLVRPEPGSRKDLQYADMVIQPIALGWHAGEWHTTVSYNLWLPTGRFTQGAINNTGKGLYSHMLSGGVTWLQDGPRPWAATAQVRYEFFGKQETTNIRPGQVMTIELAAGKEVFEGFDLGITGFASFQTTRQTGSTPGTDTGLYRFFGVGPEINWRPESLPGAQVSLRAGFEFGSRNTSQGIGTVLSFAYGF